MSELTSNPDYQLFVREQLADPYPLFGRLRETEPVHYCEPMKLWLVTRYDLVFAGLRDARFSTSRMGMYTRPLTPETRERIAPLLQHLSKWILLSDAPDHTRLRKLVNLAFTPRMLELLRPRVEQVVADLLPRVEPQSRVDLLHDFCYPLPATVICEMLGIPQDEREMFRIGTEKLIDFSSRGGPELARYADAAMDSLRELIRMFERLIEQHRKAPKDDLIGALISAEADGDRLSNEELFAMCVFLFLAGHETTTNILASGVMLLLRHPGQFHLLKEDLDGRLPGAIEEILRYEPSVPRAVRQARHDLELGGQKIKQGDTVVFMIAAANRDPAVFVDPDRMDITRQPNKHLSFGFGSHFCLGAQLARMEIDVAYRALFRRLPNLSLATEQIEWKPLMGIRAMKALEIIT